MALNDVSKYAALNVSLFRLLDCVLYSYAEFVITVYSVLVSLISQQTCERTLIICTGLSLSTQHF